MAPDKLEFNYPEDFPSYEDVMCNYANRNPEFLNLLAERTRALVKPIYLDDNNEPLPDRTIERNKEYTRVRIFYILRQLEGNESWEKALASRHEGQDRVAATDEEFEECPRTFFKTVQEILSQPTERLAVDREDEKLAAKDLSDIVIDPALITPALLANLGLDEYIPPKGSRMNPAQKIAHMARAIPAIKEMLANTEPMDLPYKWHQSDANYFRLLRINAGKNRGFVLGTQVIKGKKRLFKTDLHGAYRRLTHIMQESYREELRVLNRITAIVRQVHKRLAEWPLTKDEILKTREELLSCVDSLKHVTNAHKVEMRTRIANAVSLKSERLVQAKYKRMPDGNIKLIREEIRISAYNPGAKRASLITIPSFVEKRKEEIKAISAHLAKDRVLSDDYISQQQQPFEIFYGTVDSMSTKLKIFSLDEPLGIPDKQKIARNLGQLRQQCNPDQSSTRIVPLMQPYLAFGEKMTGHIDGTLDSLDREGNVDDRQSTAVEFMKIYLVAKIQHFYIHLQRVYERFLSPKEIPNFDDLNKALSTLGRLIGQKRVNAVKTLKNRKELVTLETPEYNAVYHKIYQLISELRGLALAARNMAGMGPDAEDDMKKIRLEMKRMIKNFRFDELVRSAGQLEDDPVLTSTPEGERPTWPSPASDPGAPSPAPSNPGRERA